MPKRQQKRNVPKDKQNYNNHDVIESKYFKGDDSHNKSTDMKIPAPHHISNVTTRRLPFNFYDIPGLELAKALLGQKLVRIFNGERLSGIIVETEAYLGRSDKAAHSYSGKITGRNGAMFMDPGTAYVYNIYGMYCCMNISSQGEGSCILLRALEPLEGLDTMKTHRSVRRKNGADGLKTKDLCNGPSKLCQSLSINKANTNTANMVLSDHVWLEPGRDIKQTDIVVSTRIGISGAGEAAASKPYRFYVYGSDCVSVRDKAAEALMARDK